MSQQQKPVDVLQSLAAQRAQWPDEAILDELRSLPGLPDEDDPVWRDEDWRRRVAYLYVALMDLAAQRKLKPAIRLLLERASYGDFGEMMRELRHALEAILEPDWTALAAILIETAQANRPGTRLWSVDELRVLDDRRIPEILVAALADEAEGVRTEAYYAIRSQYERFPEHRVVIIERLNALCSERQMTPSSLMAKKLLQEFESIDSDL